MRQDTWWDLLNAGDWACAHGDAEALGRVARSLALLAGSAGLAADASRVAAVAPVDLDRASSQWSRLAVRLRHDASPAPGYRPRP